MALSSRLGCLVQKISGQRTSMLNAIRCVSSTKLFVGGLSFGTDDQSLRDAFNCFGDVTEARVITDRDSGRSRGFGFVNFATGEAASSALSSMDGQELQGRSIRVSFANDKPTGGYRNTGGYGNGFGTGGGSYGTHGGDSGDFGGGDSSRGF